MFINVDCILYNCISGIRDQRGCRIPDDLYNEFLNLALAKTLSSHNTTAAVVESHSKSLYFAHQVRIEHLKETTKELYSSTDVEVSRQKDYDTILQVMEDADLFVRIEGREGFKGFEDVPDNIYAHRNTKDQTKWAQTHITRFAKHGFLHTDSSVGISKQSLDTEFSLDANDDFVVNLRSRLILRQEAVPHTTQ